MNLDQLRTAKVIGYWTMPGTSLCEANPTAYNNAMAEAPPHAGSCAYCGMAIMNHVIVRLQDQTVACIGVDCAVKVGSKAQARDAREAVNRARREANWAKQREQREARRLQWEADHADEIKAAQEREAARLARVASRHDKIATKLVALAPVLHALDDSAYFGNDFHRSLATQLRSDGSLSPRQAEYAVKALLGNRRTKANGEEWDTLVQTLSEYVE